jgi:DNA-3-methyladenine glycosylase
LAGPVSAAGAGQPLPATFFDRPPRAVARDLLGAVVVRGEVAVSLTEVEAYEGASDPASHAHRGPTRRNAAMFGPPGHAYVYFTYGMHWCLNVVCGPGTTAGAVLLRAGGIVGGLATARGRARHRADAALARGPACLAQVLAVDGALDGTDLTAWPGELAVVAGGPVPDRAVAAGPRVGVRAATERPWRYWIEDAPSVSVRPRGNWAV